MVRKITRIFIKTLSRLLLVLFLLAIALYFCIQTYTFQTWLGHRAGEWLSKELNTEVSIEKINLDFFSKANLENVLVLDKHRDTILSANLLMNITNFDYKHQSFRLDKIVLKNAVSKVIKYKEDNDFNFQFLLDYFDSGKQDTTKHSQGWDVKFGDVELSNVAFTYRNGYEDTKVSQNMNYDNIVANHIYGTLSDFKMKGDTVSVSIKNLTAKEQCGIELQNLTTRVSISERQLLCENLRLKTKRSFLKGSINFSYSNWDDYSDFISKVKMNCLLKDSSCANFGDIAFFAEELNGLNETVFLSGTVKGYVSDLNLQNFKLAYGHHTRFKGNLSLTGLPDIYTSYLHFDAREISTSYSDLINIPNYPFYENKKLSLPVELQSLGTVSYQGKFDGFVTDFSTYGTFNTGLGSAISQVSVRIGEKNDDVSYRGKIKTQNFDLGTLLFGNSDFNALSMNCDLEGKGTDIKTMEAKLKGEISNISYNNYNYKNIVINGSIESRLFSGLLICKDQNADFHFDGTVNFQNKVPEMDFDASVKYLRLNELHFTTDRDSGSLSSRLSVSIAGDNIDKLSGYINIDSTVYKTKTKAYKLSSLYINLEQSTPNKNITLNSAYLDASLKGRFNAANLKTDMEDFLSTYYPSFFAKPTKLQKNEDELSLKLKIKRFNEINALLLPDVMLSAGTEIEGSYNAADKKINLNFKSSKASYKSFTMHELQFNLGEKDSSVQGSIFGKTLNLSDSIALLNTTFEINSKDKNFNYLFHWDNLSNPANKGRVEGTATFEKNMTNLQCRALEITARDSAWSLTNPSLITIQPDGSIYVNAFEVACHNQHINISGALSNKTGDSLVVNTKNVILQQFNPVLKDDNIKLEGLLNGNIKLSNLQGNFVLDGDLRLSELKINDNTVGELSVSTNYNASEKVMQMNGYTSLGLQDGDGNQVKNISFSGRFFPDKKEESIDVDFTAEPANLKLLNPFLSGILTINNAFVSGGGKIHGTPSNIKLDGKLRLFNSEIKVDYTNVVYNVTGDIEIMPDQIRFSDLLMREKGTKTVATGTVNGNIFHNNFKKIQIDYDVTFKNMLTLNTTAAQNTSYYGKVYGTGNMGIYGFLNNLNMEINAKTNKNSKFVLPLDGPAEMDDGGFIHFVKKDTITLKKESDLGGFNLRMRLHATPDATTQIIMDQATGDVLNVQGDGDLDIRINTLGKFEMFGDYIISNGDYLFTLENIISKKFDIDAGSSISWSGDPMNADINVSTSYKQRVSIGPLLNDTTGKFKARSPVDCKLIISEKLFSPNIKFAIDFPSVDATNKALINNILSDETELNRQVFSFLLFRTFVTPQIYSTNTGGVTAGSAAASTGSEMLSNRMSEFLNTYFTALTGMRNLQMGLNYKAGTQTSNQAVDLTLSKQFLNNRVSVDGNIGLNNQTGSTNSVIGDVNIEYKVSNDGRYRLKAYYRSNDNTQVITNGGPNTQGIGFFYRREFDTFNELLKHYNKKTKHRK